MQLDDIEGIVSCVLANVVNGSINEHPHALALCGQISWTLTDVATGFGPKDKAHPCNGQLRIDNG